MTCHWKCGNMVNDLICRNLAWNLCFQRLFTLFDSLIFWLWVYLMVVIWAVNTKEYFYTLFFFLSLKYSTTTHLLFNTKYYTFIHIIQSYEVVLIQNIIHLFVLFKVIESFKHKILYSYVYYSKLLTDFLMKFSRDPYQSLQFWYPVFCHKLL